jgi:hypothetical protein
MKRVWLLTSALFFCSFVFSQIIDNQHANTLLWRISGHGLKKPSYIFGTMHILCAEDAFLSKSFKKDLDSVDQVFFEIDMGDMSAMMGAFRFMTMKDNMKLSNLLDSVDYQKVKEYFNKHGSIVPFSILEKFKPMLLSGLMEDQEMPCSTTDGMEWVILKEAKGKGKTTGGLETAEFQASLFDSIPYKDQAEELIKEIDSSAYYRRQSDTLVKAYRDQDLEKIEKLTIEENGQDAHVLELLLYRRNQKWVNSLQILMEKQSLMIAVGAGHLPGENGLLNLLRKIGYIVSPVFDSGNIL